MKVIGEGTDDAKQGFGPVIGVIDGMRRGGYIGGEREIF
jgi:hypothetical protein